MKETVEVGVLGDLQEAYNGSFYTVLGAGGDLSEWVEGLGGLLKEQGIGEPVAWYQTTGEAVNRFAYHDRAPDFWRDPFAGDLVVLMFPLDGLDVGKLAIFKLKMQDRWFDDVVDNMRHR